METDAKNPRQAGTVAKKPRGTDAKNPPQLAPLQKPPVTVWNVPTVAKNPYYRHKKPQPLYTVVTFWYNILLQHMNKMAYIGHSKSRAQHDCPCILAS